MLPKRLILIAAMCLGGCHWGLAQKSSPWRVYRTSDGLADSFVASVSVGLRTNVWARHFDVPSVSWLNGYKVRTQPAPHPGNNRIYESRAGQIWTAYPEGLQEFKNNTWISYPVDEIRREYQTNLLRHARSLSLSPVKQGRVLFLLSDALMEFNNEWAERPEVTVVRRAQDTGLEKFSDMVTTRDGTLWIAGKRGLLRVSTGGRALSAETEWTEFLASPALHVQELQHPMPDSTSGGIVAVGESLQTGRKVVVLFDGENWQVIPSGRANIRQAWRGWDGTLWAITINALLRLNPVTGEFAETDEVSSGRFFDVAVEPGGVFWLATSDGLFRHTPPVWRAPQQEGIAPGSAAVHGVAEDAEGRLWVAATERLHLLETNRWRSFPLPEPVEVQPQSGQTVLPLRDGTVALLLNGRLVRFEPATGSFLNVSHASGAQIRPLGLMKDGALCVEFHFVKKNGSNLPRLALFNGRTFPPFPGPMPNLAEEDRLLFLFAASNGDTWLSTTSGLHLLRDGAWKHFIPSDSSLPDLALSLAEMGDGKIWCGGRDTLWEFDGKAWTAAMTGFDRVNSILKARDGSVWLATHSGLQRRHLGAWLINSAEEGLPVSSITKIYEDRRGRIWAGTPRGLNQYHPEADTDPPQTVILSPKISTDGSVSAGFIARDKWKFTPTEHLQYSYRLDEQEWSPFQTERSVTFADLSPGKHYFQVRSMDRNWNLDPRPALLEFEIPIPWYKETRLILIAFAGLAGILFFAGLAFNRHRRLLHSYAEVERLVDIRTRQLQDANAQLLHSQKMNALGTLAAGVAHDFNNILSIIKGSAQIIEANPGDREKIKTRVNRIKTVVEQGAGIVRAMLGFSRPTESAVPCDLNKVAEETLQLLGDRFLQEIEVKFEPAPGLPQITLPRDFVQQILLNFIFNAADATNGPGRIVLCSAVVNLPPATCVLPPEPGAPCVALSVQDFGCGIAPEVLPRIFEPFFTTKAFSSRRGTGLGLSMVYQMAKEMGWGLAVESAPGKGSTFTLLIPVRGASVPAAERPATNQPNQPKHAASGEIKPTEAPR